MAYTDAAAVKVYLGIPSATTADDTFLGLLIARAQAMIDAFCVRTFEGASAARLFDAERDVCGPTLRLDKDLASVSAVVNGDGTAVAVGNYVTEPRNEAPFYALTLRATSGLTWTWSTDPANAISVTGVWAYSATAPADIVQACTRLTAWFYRQKEGNMQADQPMATPGGIVLIPSRLPSDVKELLIPYKRRMT